MLEQKLKAVGAMQSCPSAAVRGSSPVPACSVPLRPCHLSLLHPSALTSTLTAHVHFQLFPFLPKPARGSAPPSLTQPALCTPSCSSHGPPRFLLHQCKALVLCYFTNRNIYYCPKRLHPWSVVLQTLTVSQCVALAPMECWGLLLLNLKCKF